MEKYSTQFRSAKRDTILKTFPPEYREKWYEMRGLQNKRYEAIQAWGIFFVASLIFGIGGLLLLIKMIKDSDNIFFALSLIGFGIFYLICFFIMKSKEKKDSPELRQKIRVLKRSCEVKMILESFKEAEVKWTLEDDMEFAG